MGTLPLACYQYYELRATCKALESVRVFVQPPLEEIPDGDWYCPTCVTDGKDKKWRSRRRAAPKQATPPPPKKVLGNRALAAMMSEDEDSEADGGVTVKVLDRKDR